MKHNALYQAELRLAEVNAIINPDVIDASGAGGIRTHDLGLMGPCSSICIRDEEY